MRTTIVEPATTARQWNQDGIQHPRVGGSFERRQTLPKITTIGPWGFGSARCNPNQSLEMTNKPSGIRLTFQSYSLFVRVHGR